MSLFIFFQFIQLLLILIIKIGFSTNITLLNILTFTPIISSVFYVTYYHHDIEKKSKILYYSILSALFGDLCLIYYNQSLGISFFFVAQCFYFSYLNNQRDLKVLTIFAIINLALCISLGEDMLKPEAAIYALITLFNIIKSIKLIIKRKIRVEYFVSFIFLMLCDISLFIIFMLEEYNITFINSNIFFIIEWICYICFQILLSTSITNHSDYQFNLILEKAIRPLQKEENYLEKCKKI